MFSGIMNVSGLLTSVMHSTGLSLFTPHQKTQFKRNEDTFSNYIFVF